MLATFCWSLVLNCGVDGEAFHLAAPGAAIMAIMLTRLLASGRTSLGMMGAGGLPGLVHPHLTGNSIAMEVLVSGS